MNDKNFLIELSDDLSFLGDGINAARALSEHCDNIGHLPEYQLEEAKTWVFDHLSDDLQEILDKITVEHRQEKDA